ncbi:hypothetical protein BVRB_5g114290 [Beta vulgaris subsp. vulgaris]|nr:hypothetical protein BVRB_5g114290 [Beta vulgaris subsp. vulgaris]
MERKVQLKLESLVLAVLLISWLALQTSACPYPGFGCKGCIAERLKFHCSSCIKTFRCIAKCQWGGTSKKKCTKQCDSKKKNPKSSKCRKCLSKCKCNCAGWN